MQEQPEEKLMLVLGPRRPQPFEQGRSWMRTLQTYVHSSTEGADKLISEIAASSSLNCSKATWERGRKND
jgi:hypothetical protein